MEQVIDPKQSDYPILNLGGREFALKFRFSDVFRLKREHKIDLLESTEMKGSDLLIRMLRVVEAGIAHDATQAVNFDCLCDLAEMRDIVAIGEAVQLAIKPLTQKQIQTETPGAPISVN
jgi:hypothetical protein